MTIFFAADIGGTKSELALFDRADSLLEPLVKKRYVNADFSGVEQVIESFLRECDHQVPRQGCLALAGIVSGGRASLTNLPWHVDCSLLERRFGFRRLMLLNDMTALCTALEVLGDKELLCIQEGKREEEGIRGVIAPGTGLGQGMVVDMAGRLYCRGTEGGHVDFAPVNEEQSALLDWLRKKTSPVSYEMVAAGPGLARLYDFCRENYQLPESANVAAEMSAVVDRVPVIVKNATADTPCSLCRYALELFLSILGSEAGNLALKLYASGGVYLGGGILPRLAGRINFDTFMRGFCAKGAMSSFVQRIPVFLILRRDATLLGAAHHCRRTLQSCNPNE